MTGHFDKYNEPIHDGDVLKYVFFYDVTVYRSPYYKGWRVKWSSNGGHSSTSLESHLKRYPCHIIKA